MTHREIYKDIVVIAGKAHYDYVLQVSKRGVEFVV